MKRIRFIVTLPRKVVLDTTKRVSTCDAVIGELGTMSSVLLPRKDVNPMVLASETYNNLCSLDHNIS